MERRPTAVALVSSLLVLVGFFGIPSEFYYFYKHVDDEKFQEMYQADPHAVWFSFLFLGISYIISIVAGKFMLQAAPWARITYTIWAVVLVVGALLSHNEPVIISIILVNALMITCLYLPSSNKFFSSGYYGI